MAREISSIFSFNRGIVDKRGLGRIDVKRLALAAQQQKNWMCRVLGSMSLRVGWKYLGGIYNNLPSRTLKFCFSTTDLAELELTANLMRVWISDALVTRPAVTTAITNGTFPTDLAGWTDNDEAGATSSWVSPNYMQLVGSGTTFAIREQQVTTVEAGVEHALRIVITRGPVMLRVGSTSGDDNYVRETTLYTGTHSIAFTPTGNFYVRFFSRGAQKVWVSQCKVEAAGVLTLPTPWAAADLGNIRTDQSADVIFVACQGIQQRRIERRGTHPGGRSWSVALYAPTDGPFNLQNVTPTTLTASALTGNITLTASAALFKSTHVGALFSLTSVGQAVTTTASASGVATSSIRVTGISTGGGGARTFSLIISGNATASTVKLQRSYDNSTWADVGAAYTYTADITGPVDDGLDNQIVYYRLLLYTRVAPDTVTMKLIIGSGSVRGIVRITDYASSTSADAEVLKDLGGTSAASIWQEGKWSALAGWPTAVRIHEGRMWWSGLNGVNGSVSDAYDSFDETYLGDAGPINRTIGSGPVDTINWLLSLKGLLVGAQGAEYCARASSLDEPLTVTNFNMKVSSTQGSGVADAVKVDQTGYFINRAGVKIYDLSFNLQSYDYASTDLMELAPELGLPGIVRIDVQRMPDTRLHCVRSDGTVVVIVINKAEDMLALLEVETDGYVEDVVVQPAIPGDLDDQVYYTVRRTINGATVRYREKWAQEVDCRGDQAQCMLADSYVAYSGWPTTVVSGLGHLEGKSVVVWADGADVGTNDSARPWTQTYTVTGGQITLPVAAGDIVVGLPYSATFKSAKLGQQSAEGSPLNRQKRVGHIGLILTDMHRKGLRFGPDFDTLDDMPEIEAGAPVTDEVVGEYDENLIEFPGHWTTDARICLLAQAPRPATVVAVTPDMALYS
jgi:hypothetical protein